MVGPCSARLNLNTGDGSEQGRSDGVVRLIPRRSACRTLSLRVIQVRSPRQRSLIPSRLARRSRRRSFPSPRTCPNRHAQPNCPSQSRSDCRIRTFRKFRERRPCPNRCCSHKQMEYFALRSLAVLHKIYKLDLQFPSGSYLNIYYHELDNLFSRLQCGWAVRLLRGRHDGRRRQSGRACRHCRRGFLRRGSADPFLRPPLPRQSRRTLRFGFAAAIL
jgi:hypothetical protein